MQLVISVSLKSITLEKKSSPPQEKSKRNRGREKNSHLLKFYYVTDVLFQLYRYAFRNPVSSFISFHFQWENLKENLKVTSALKK